MLSLNQRRKHKIEKDAEKRDEQEKKKLKAPWHTHSMEKNIYQRALSKIVNLL